MFRVRSSPSSLFPCLAVRGAALRCCGGNALLPVHAPTLSVQRTDDVVTPHIVSTQSAPLRAEGGLRRTAMLRSPLPPADEVRELRDPDGTVYRGAVRDNVPHGEGEETSADGTTIIRGTWKNGVKHGRMTIVRSQGVMEVDYVDGVKSSTVKITFSKGLVFEGELKHVQQEGGEVQTSVDGITFSLDQQNPPNFDGASELTLPDGQVLRGTYRRGKMHGTMEVTSHNAVKTVEHVDGVAARTGTIKFHDGRVYEGEMKNFVIVGFGVMSMPDGRVFRGTYDSNSNSNGPGVLTFPDGAVLAGTWRNNEAHGPMRFTTKTEVVEVDFVKGVAARTGTVRYKDGRVYEGEIENYTPHGAGAVTFPNGQVVRGTWRGQSLTEERE